MSDVRPLRIGMIGLDTSHAVAFTKVLNDPSDPHHVKGGKVTVAFPGGSDDFDLSRDRVAGFTQELRSKYAVEMVDSPEAVAEAVDLVFLESVDGRVHLEQFKRIARFKKPTFIDKPLAVGLNHAREIFRIAEEQGTTVMSSSTLRYAPGVAEARGSGDVLGCDIYGPMQIQPVLPGWYWYGVHTIEAMVGVMGPGCREVQVVMHDKAELLIARWQDGRIATARGDRSGHWDFGMTLHREKGSEQMKLDGGKHAELVERVIQSLPTGRPDVPKEETLEVMKILDAANRSRGESSLIKLD